MISTTTRLMAGARRTRTVLHRHRWEPETHWVHDRPELCSTGQACYRCKTIVFSHVGKSGMGFPYHWLMRGWTVRVDQRDQQEASL